MKLMYKKAINLQIQKLPSKFENRKNKIKNQNRTKKTKAKV